MSARQHDLLSAVGVTASTLEDQSEVTKRDRRPLDQPRLSFCDLSALFAETGGGIRTYHEAKLKWFAAQRHHDYTLIVPGSRERVRELSPSTRVISVYGPTVASAYRIPLNLHRFVSWIDRLRPHIVETGDPWFSGPMGLLAKRRGYTPVVSSFFHGDPIRTYVAPWAERGRPNGGRALLVRKAERYFFRVQRLYDVTVTSSGRIESMLRDYGIRRTLRSPFGVDWEFLAVGRQRLLRAERRRARLLYAGRLQRDKGIDLLLDALPRILQDTDAEITIAGNGPARDACQRYASARLRVLGYVTDRPGMAALYGAHDILLAPGPHETFGLAALEALAAGLVVVGPNAGGVAELLGQLPRPRLFEAGNAGDLVRAVRDALSAPGDGEVEASVALAERYGTWEDAIAGGVENYCRFWSRCTT
jgi:alpha-1,6-mannosyltransferase